MKIILILCTFLALVYAQDLRKTLPSTLSSDWQQFYQSLPDPTKVPPLPKPNDIQAWKQVYDVLEAPQIKRAAKFAQDMGVKTDDFHIAGVGVMEVLPKNYHDNHKILIYIHGGAYTFFSARSSLVSATLAANYTHLRTIAIDYTNPPKAKYKKVLHQVTSVIKALVKQGYSLKDIAVYGDSAGGALAAGAVLKLRDEGFGMPAVVVLWSPWADITQTGDTYITLKDAEPFFIYDTSLKASANAYADPKDQKNPYISPVYANYSKGFPPTLIQGGTREIFLSNFVRLYQKMDQEGVIVKLDLYEGMPHVFQTKLPHSHETKAALKKMEKFIQKYMPY